MMKLGMQAKTGGTLVEFASATLMILYKRIAVILMHRLHQTAATSKSSTDRNWLKGSLVLLGVVILGLVIYVQTVLVRTRGAVFMTAFRPLSTIVAAVL
ncbi:hypothetical protein C1H46_034919 [Malus baccata]|uniref:WAT1-related protein n=1 Tax=Malus baccata TaxID=106549 RepID=A0A540KZQ4_MALBA|nr:hypothetical protein C1H46_034919 [Malus baccata]